MSWIPDFSRPLRTLTEGAQRLIRGSRIDRFEVAFWVVLILVQAIFTPVDIVFGLLLLLMMVLIRSGIWQFAGVLQSKGFDNPVYKKNLQRLIERNRQLEGTTE